MGLAPCFRNHEQRTWLAGFSKKPAALVNCFPAFQDSDFAASTQLQPSVAYFSIKKKKRVQEQQLGVSRQAGNGTVGNEES